MNWFSDWSKRTFAKWYMAFAFVFLLLGIYGNITGENLILSWQMFLWLAFLSLLFSNILAYRQTFREYTRSMPTIEIENVDVAVKNWIQDISVASTIEVPISIRAKEAELGQSEYDAIFQRHLFDCQSSENCRAVKLHPKQHRIYDEWYNKKIKLAGTAIGQLEFSVLA